MCLVYKILLPPLGGVVPYRQLLLTQDMCLLLSFSKEPCCHNSLEQFRRWYTTASHSPKKDFACNWAFVAASTSPAKSAWGTIVILSSTAPPIPTAMFALVS